MITEAKILKNSLFLTIQPILLNIMSLAVIGYISRNLGVSDFGIFNFVITLIMLFWPVGRMGLDNISVRELASIRDHRAEAENYAGKIILFRVALAIFSVIVIVLVINITGYSERILYAAFCGAWILFFQLISESLTDIFMSYEKMELTAFSHLVGGLLLTILSVIVIYLGFGLFGLILSYSVGHIITSIIALKLINSKIFNISLNLDWEFCRDKFQKGLPFFFMSMMWYSMMRLDTIFLSKTVSATELGIYTAGIMLVTKLSIIPQGIGSSLFPAISNLYNNDKHEEMYRVIRNYFSYVLVVVLPIIIIVHFYGTEIMVLIFGKEYAPAGAILSYSSWVLLIRCYAFMEFSILSATNRQNSTLASYILASLFCVLMNYYITLNFQLFGALATFISTQFVVLILFTILVAKKAPKLFHIALLVKTIFLNLLFLLLLYYFDKFIGIYEMPYYYIFVSILFFFLYFVGLFFVRILKLTDITKVRSLVRIR